MRSCSCQSQRSSLQTACWKPLASATPNPKGCKSRSADACWNRRSVVDQLDEFVARVRVSGPVLLPFDGWDHASIWGWDERADSLFAELRRNTDDSAAPPTIRIGPDDLTPPIRIPETLAM